jgi:hypothetical protein
MSRNRGDTSLLHVLRTQEWPPRESDGIAARGIEFSVRQSNPFRRATISRRAARAKVRAGTPQNTSSIVSRAHSAHWRRQVECKAHLILLSHKTRCSRYVPTRTARAARAALQRPRSTSIAPTLRARARARSCLPSGACARGRAGPLSPCSDDEGSAGVDEAIYDRARAQLKRC